MPITRDRHQPNEWFATVEARQAVRDEALRVLASRKLTDADLDAHQRGRMPMPPATLTHCNGPCEQGRRLCPCPEACARMADDAGPLTWRSLWSDSPVGFRVAAYIVAAIILVAGAWHIAALWL